MNEKKIAAATTAEAKPTKIHIYNRLNVEYLYGSMTPNGKKTTHHLYTDKKKSSE